MDHVNLNDDSGNRLQHNNIYTVSEQDIDFRHCNHCCSLYVGISLVQLGANFPLSSLSLHSGSNKYSCPIKVNILIVVPPALHWVTKLNGTYFFLQFFFFYLRNHSDCVFYALSTKTQVANLCIKQKNIIKKYCNFPLSYQHIRAPQCRASLCSR